MLVADKIIVVTGAAQGIGRALAVRFLSEGARRVVIADRDATRLDEAARAIGAVPMLCDVSSEQDLQRLVEETESAHGPIDLFCSNAGVLDPDPDPSNAASGANAAWNRAWAINVMAHVIAARLLVPRFVARGGGYFLNTASAAGLLSQIGSAIYSTTKHAAVGFAENLAIAHGGQGIRVSVLCPQAVDTPMLRAGPDSVATVDGVLTPERVADCVIEGLAAERFLILPHPQVATYVARKATDYDRWLSGMRRLRARWPHPIIRS